MSQQRPMSYHTGHGFKVYTYAKMAVITFQVGARLHANGVEIKEAGIRGAKAAFAWMAYVCWTLALPLFHTAAIAIPLLSRMSANSDNRYGRLTDGQLTIGVLIGAAGAIYAFLLWTVVYSIIKERIDCPSYPNPHGLLYKCGAALRTAGLEPFPGWLIGIVAILAAVPMHIYLGV